MIMSRVSRSLLAVSAALLVFGGLVHASAFNNAAAAATSSNLPDFYKKVLQAFWLMDSATLILLAIVFGLVALRPTVASRWVVVILALMPASTAALLYTFFGAFLPAHLLIAAATLAISSGLLRAEANYSFKRTADVGLR